MQRALGEGTSPEIEGVGFSDGLLSEALFLSRCGGRAVRPVRLMRRVGQRIERNVSALATQPEVAERTLGDAGRLFEAIDQVR